MCLAGHILAPDFPDQILVLDGGHIAQKGTQDELAGQDGLYRDFLDARKEAASWKLA